MLPEFIIIGAMKGGTTSLFHYLASHSETQASSIKETNFFKTPDDFSKGVSWYESLWDEHSRGAFEASPDYTKRHLLPSVPERMHSILPDVKLIYLVRDPMERIISHYIHNYSQGRESRSFSEAMKDMQSNYVLSSKYYFQIEAFLKCYSKDQILIVQSEMMKHEPARVFGEVCRFLGLSKEYDEAVFGSQFHESREKMRKSLLERWVMKNVKNRSLIRIVKFIGKRLRRPIEKPVMSESERELIGAELAPDVERLRKFSGKEFSDWSL